MKNKNRFLLMLIAIIVISIGTLMAWYINKPQRPMLQGEAVAQSYKVSSKLVGRVDSLPLKKGDVIKKGDFVFSLTVPEVEAKLTQAKALLSAASAKDAMAITGARPQEVKAVYNVWQKSVAGLTFAKQTYTRIKALYEEGVVPAQKYDEVAASLKASETTELAARAQYEMVKSGARHEDKVAAKALVEQAFGGVQEVEAYLKDAIQYSPIDGEVSSIISEKGELVNAGFPIVMVLDLNDIWFSFNIKETLMPDFKMGDTYDIYVPAIDKTVKCKISYIAPEAQYATWAATRATGDFDIRTFNIEMRPTTKNAGLRPGMSGLIKEK
ncbi:MAG: efflux RND transporter periplasmic adaptor subunit [Rikenellaceae bacterium]